MTQIKIDLDNLLPVSDVVDNICNDPESGKKALSSTTWHNLYNHIRDNYLLSGKIANYLGQDTESAASQFLMNQISTIAELCLHSKNLATVIGDSHVSAASQSLVKAISS